MAPHTHNFSGGNVLKHSEAGVGRIFIVKLEDGEIVHKCLEEFAIQHNIKSAAVLAVGALNENSRMTVGPEDKNTRPVIPLYHTLTAPHETAGVGTIFEGEDGLPRLHMHVSCGREGEGLTGCIRVGSIVWQILEVIIIELTDCNAKKVKDKSTGFEVLEP